ncbi:hypothetical protein N865_11160 [Intrasporangium oryzae NRRL B-24470]|uniref:Uncharacterized protein n=2 Tax=Intrasporangium TaxID=53357 RepID=W9G595_9MICO|nr:hypothetical protein N865_11160 [Intrasporangium oryzae NRRL B-24470]
MHHGTATDTKEHSMPDTTHTSPALARTDTDPTGAATRATIGIDRRRVSRLGLVLTAGATIWSASNFVFGPTADGVGGRVGDLTGFLFQVGVFALLTVMLRTSATGTSRAARAMVRVEFVLLGLASLWSLAHGLAPESLQDSPAIMVLDVFWPLSMLGMFVIGIKVAVAGRWRGILRGWPLVAETWAVVTVPSMVVLGDGAARWIGATHLLLGYAVLGLLLARRPELTGASE